jgi:hypothetical protein
MRIVERIIAAPEHVWWIVIVSAVDGEKVEIGFRTKSDAVAYRNALLALRRETGLNGLERHLDMVRRAQRSLEETRHA